MTEKQLIIAVEGTAAMGPYWQTIVFDYLENIIRCFCGNKLPGQKPFTSSAELSLVTFYTHGSYCDSLVLRSSWTQDVDSFLQWLSAIQFGGGGFNDAAITEGLSEALMMFPIAPNGNQFQQHVNGQRHCILVAASNPYPFPTQVYRLQMQNWPTNEQTKNRLFDVETVAKLFAQCYVSLSIICPRQLPKLRAIYDAGKRNPRAANPVVDNVKNPHFLVLISENFMEACAALGPHRVTTLASSQSLVKMDIASIPSVIRPPTSMLSGGQMVQTGEIGVNQNMMSSLGPSNVSSETSKMIPIGRMDIVSIPSVTRPPTSISSGGQMVQTGVNQNMMSGLGPSDISSRTSTMIPTAGMDITSILSVTRPPTSMPSGAQMVQTGEIGENQNMMSGLGPSDVSFGTSKMIPTVGMSIASIPSVTRPPTSIPSGGQMVQTGEIGANQNIMSGLGPSYVSSGTSTMIPTVGMPQQMQSRLQSLGVNNNSTANMTLSLPISSTLQSTQFKHVKVWEGNLFEQKQGQSIFITRIEGYRISSTSETIALNWPPIMKIAQLISHDHMYNRQCFRKADFLVFRAINQHGFLKTLQKKKLCAVIELPFQTLLLSGPDKAHDMIGMLFPGDMVEFESQNSQWHEQQRSQQQQHQQMQSQQHPHQQPQQYIQISDDESTELEMIDAIVPDEDLASVVRSMREEALSLHYIQSPHDNGSKILSDFIERFVKKFHDI